MTSGKCLCVFLFVSLFAAVAVVVVVFLCVCFWGVGGISSKFGYDHLSLLQKVMSPTTDTQRKPEFTTPRQCLFTSLADSKYLKRNRTKNTNRYKNVENLHLQA